MSEGVIEYSMNTTEASTVWTREVKIHQQIAESSTASGMLATGLDRFWFALYLESFRDTPIPDTALRFLPLDAASDLDVACRAGRLVKI